MGSTNGPAGGPASVPSLFPTQEIPGRRPLRGKGDMQGIDWRDRWARLATAVGLGPEDPVVIALSGGADSVLLAQLVARARPRPRALVVHVEHGLRGAESEGDAEFCARLCAHLGLPFVRRRAPLDDPSPMGPDLEARLRRARYEALALEAARARIDVLLTGHHADDALETLLLRWLRGTHLVGLAGLRGASERRDARGGTLRVLRPLIGMRREEVRALLRREGLAWREDSSNRDPRFARNRVRNLLLPELCAAAGPELERGLFAFARAVERLEDAFAERTAPLSWRPFEHAAAARDASRAHLGGSLPRGALRALAPPLARRALWRLLVEGTGRGPSREHLERILSDLERGHCRRHSLPGGWILALRGAELALMPPPPRRAPSPGEPLLPFAEASALGIEPGGARRLDLPGELRLADGRMLAARLIESPAGRPPPRDPLEVELCARGLEGPLLVRAPRPGDRFRGLGAPGSRPLARVLADAGVPREERAAVPLVLCGDEILWIAGLRPSEARRVRPSDTRRLALSLLGAAPGAPRGRAHSASDGQGLFAGTP